jgi:restriction system protein
MALETEKAKRDQQGQHLATLAAKQKETHDREEMKKQLYALFAMSDPKKRGKALEGVLNRLFSSHGLTVREAFSVANGESGAVRRSWLGCSSKNC